MDARAHRRRRVDPHRRRARRRPPRAGRGLAVPAGGGPSSGGTTTRACEPAFPRTAVLIPAWNEGAVIGASIDRLMAAEYPPESLRVYVVDDASTDDTP